MLGANPHRNRNPNLKNKEFPTMNKNVMDLLSEKERTFNEKELAALAAYFRMVMFDTLHDRGTGHWGGAASSAELTTSLYFNRMHIKPENPLWEDRDRFILSKGHASVNLYTVLAHRGYFSPSEISTFRVLGSRLQGHPSMHKLPGVDMSTGALGHGLSIGLGMAMAAKLSKKDYWTYVLTGEGCLNEGQSWEALMSAAKFKPEHFVLMVDYNKVQLDGTEDQIMPMNSLTEKLSAFGWNVCKEKLDGNNTGDILKSFTWMDSDDVWPKAVVYDTVKGKGVSFTEGKSAWHGAVIDDDSYSKGIVELKKDLQDKEAAI
jgi:transketolase